MDLINMISTTKLAKQKQTKLASGLQSEKASQRVPVRSREFKLPDKPLRILAAPDILQSNSCRQLIDWKSTKLGVAIGDTVFLQDIIGKSDACSIAHYDRITSCKLDKLAEGLAVGDPSGGLSIYDTRVQKRVRTISNHVK